MRLASTTDLIFKDGFELGICGPWTGWSDGATADETECADCPTSLGLNAAITAQIEDLFLCAVDIQIVSLTTIPIQLGAQSVDTPPDIVVDSLTTTECAPNGAGTRFRCEHDMRFDYTATGSFDGDYDLHLTHQCDPAMPHCPLCSDTTEQVISFTLNGTSCTEVEVLPAKIRGNVWFDVDGDGTRDPGDPPLSTWKHGALVEIFADADANGLPDGAPLATSLTALNGDYAFAGLDGTYVLRALRPSQPSWCVSSGPDSQHDENTGYTPPITAELASPQVVVSGVDLALTAVCP